MSGKIRLSDDEWRRILTPGQFEDTRQHCMEPPCSGRYHDFHGEGIYRCVCCGYELFSSREKSQLPERWPTFRAPITEERITVEPRIVAFLVRTAVKCGRCDAHLGYVFPDRKQRACTRYLVNSAALIFHDDRDPRAADSATGGQERALAPGRAG